MADSTGETGSAASRATWQEFYEAAMLELDKAKLTRRIIDARHAILDRQQILTTSPSDEGQALNDALYSLRILEEVTAERPAA
jgi:hypothetical protein